MWLKNHQEGETVTLFSMAESSKMYCSLPLCVMHVIIILFYLRLVLVDNCVLFLMLLNILEETEVSQVKHQAGSHNNNNIMLCSIVPQIITHPNIRPVKQHIHSSILLGWEKQRNDVQLYTNIVIYLENQIFAGNLAVTKKKIIIMKGNHDNFHPF